MAPEATGGATPPEPGTEAAIDQEAAKAALDVMAQLKDAGIENPTGLLDTVKNLREFEKGKKLPKAVERELDDLRTKLKAADDAKLSDAERTSKRLAELEAQIEAGNTKAQEKVGRSALKAAAAAAGALYPADVPALIPATSLKFDDAEEPINADELVEELKKSRPALFGKAPNTSLDGGARGTGGGGKQDMESLLREAAGR